MIVRPSARWTINSSAVVVTSLARGTFSIAEEVIPRLDEFVTMLDYQLTGTNFNVKSARQRFGSFPLVFE